MCAASDSAKHVLKSGLSLSNFGSRTDVGKVRDHNEDTLFAKHPLFAVFDGMGGHAAGEVASEIACEVVSSKLPNITNATQLGQAVEEANLAIIDAASNGRGKQGMGTTCTAAILEGENLSIAQVGDSRAYLLHDGKLQQLTRDHSYVAELVEQGQITKDYARVHPMRSKITRALGTDPNMVADLYEINVSSGDRLLLCTDGLYSMITDDDIEHILSQTADPQIAADKLIEEACVWGGHDNVTVIVVDIAGFREIKKKKVARKTKITAMLVILILLSLIAGAFALYNHWVSESAYLADSGGTVAIYRGIPGSTSPSDADLVKKTDISLADLDDSISRRIKDKEIKATSLSEINQLVDSYKQKVDEKKKEEKKQQEAAEKSADSSAEKSQEASDQN